MLMRDHFAELSTYLTHLLRRRYQMRRSIFNEIVKTCEAKTCYSKRKRNAVGLLGFLQSYVTFC
jgi:hypothetical protein